LQPGYPLPNRSGVPCNVALPGTLLHWGGGTLLHGGGREKVADILLPHGVVKAGVFGSVAKGEEMPESNINFPVELESARTLLDLSGLRLDLMDRYQLNREVDVEVDVVTYRALHPKLRDRILREQISILCVALPGAGVRRSKRATINLGNRASMTFLNVDKHGRSTLPEHVRRDLGIDGDEGALVVLEKTARGTWKRVPAALVPRDQLWLHHPELRDRLEEAERDFREGRSTRKDTPEEAQRYLDSLKG